MDYKEFVNESILFFENAKKRDLERLEYVKRSNIRLQLEKEIETFSNLKGFWDQENKRIDMMKKYSINWDNSL